MPVPVPIPRTALTLGALVGVALLLVLGVDRGTRSLVESTRARVLERTLVEVLPAANGDEPVRGAPAPERIVPAPDATEPYAPRWIEWRRIDGRPAGMAMSVIAPDGYNGDIALLVGVRVDGTISGVRVTDHRETPGLGDDIERRRSDWITRFDGLSLDTVPPSDWAVRRHGGRFDAFTGATITPQAVVDAVHGALSWAERHGTLRGAGASR